MYSCDLFNTAINWTDKLICVIKIMFRSDLIFALKVLKFECFLMTSKPVLRGQHDKMKREKRVGTLGASIDNKEHGAFSSNPFVICSGRMVDWLKKEMLFNLIKVGCCRPK